VGAFSLKFSITPSSETTDRIKKKLGVQKWNGLPLSPCQEKHGQIHNLLCRSNHQFKTTTYQQLHNIMIITPLAKRSLIKWFGMCPFSSISLTNGWIFSRANFDTRQPHISHLFSLTTSWSLYGYCSRLLASMITDYFTLKFHIKYSKTLSVNKNLTTMYMTMPTLQKKNR